MNRSTWMLLIFLFAASALAQTPRPAAILLTHDQLQDRLTDPKASTTLRLLDARPRADYDKGHIPGAVWVDVKAATTIASEPNGRSNKTAWENWSASLGLSPETRVYVYDAKRQLDAARVWWLLSYLGQKQVGLIDGGYALWVESKRPVSSAPVRPVGSPFRVQFQNDRLATREDALEALETGSGQIVDARTLEEYTGSKALAERAGHVPSACRIEWTDLVDQDGRFLGTGVLKSKLASSGLKSGSAITHCQGGGRSSVDAFVLERLGIATRNYYLGWSDWGNADETPVATGEKPGTIHADKP